MFYPPCFNYSSYASLNMMRPEKAYLRVLHASPDAPAVDVYANGAIIARGLAYRGFTSYLEVVPGQYDIKIFPAGQTSGAVLHTSMDIAARTIQTIAAAGKLANLSLLPAPEPVMVIPPGKLFLRFVHLSPDAPRVDIVSANGTMLFKNIGFKEIADYIPVNPGVYTIQARVAGTDRVILYVPNINLTAGRFYTIYAVGLAEGTPSLQVLIPLDGNSYIKF